MGELLLSDNNKTFLGIWGSTTQAGTTTGERDETAALAPKDNNQISDLLKHGVYYAKLLVFLGGCLGNVLSVIIWGKSEFRKMPRCVVCISLAVVNTLYLILTFSHSTMVYFHDEYFLGESDISCKIKSTLLGFVQHMDSFLIVFLSVERSLSVFKPHLVKIIFDHTVAAVYALIITFLFLIFNGCVAVYDASTMQLPNGTPRCTIDQTPRIFIRQLLIGIIPLVIIIPCNLVTVVKVIAQYIAMRNVVVITQQHVQKKKAIKVTVMTLSITLTYIALILPSNVYFLCCRYYSPAVLFGLTLLPMVNSGVNCYMYTLVSKDYRQKVIVLFIKAYTYSRNALLSLCQNSVQPIQ